MAAMKLLGEQVLRPTTSGNTNVAFASDSSRCFQAQPAAKDANPSHRPCLGAVAAQPRGLAVAARRKQSGGHRRLTAGGRLVHGRRQAAGRGQEKFAEAAGHAPTNAPQNQQRY
eukprot:GHVT01044823.1.p2 GENE.GHVT01044823.1~~GHVT01044823.1.p2  ORF type:complete len:114 (-),score=33.90 GHVT01044823.1:979-1320(-)